MTLSPVRPGDILSTRALNRALLARQMLLERWEGSAEAAIEQLVAMQAQEPKDPYVGLWSRLHAFQPDELSRLILGRRAVRMSLLRTTLHLVSARDCLALRPVLQPVLERHFYSGSPFGRQVAGVDIEAVLAAGRALLDEQPRTTGQLARLLGEQFPGWDANSLAYAVHHLVPLVQIPPRGLWGGSGQATWTTVEQWLGRPLDTEGGVEELLLRYLGAFGPASVLDAQNWSGLTKLREVIEGLRPRLRSFRSEAGLELFDLPDAPRPDADMPAPPRFLPQYDNVFLGHQERSRIIAEADRKRVVAANRLVAAVLIDGFIRAVWTVKREGSRATLVIEPFEPLSAEDAAAVGEEGRKLLDLVAAGMEQDIRFVDAGAS